MTILLLREKILLYYKIVGQKNYILIACFFYLEY